MKWRASISKGRRCRCHLELAHKVIELLGVGPVSYTHLHQRLWEKLDSHYYDMIIVDEFHHAAAPSYQKLLSYFKPRILLGLTACLLYTSSPVIRTKKGPIALSDRSFSFFIYTKRRS